MRKVALAVAALFVLAVVAPAFSQPFADVPTDHWAFDAVAELAAKGIVEGYPDGTFKGDRAMTRYEMAMVVARILARIEAIKIPPPPPPVKIPPPEVTRKDIVTLTRLLTEFRAELAALGVRVTAVEEELAALRARLDNVRITGDVRFRYSFFPAGSPSTATGVPTIVYRNRMTFRGQIAPNVAAVVRTTTAPGPSATSASQFSFATPSAFGLVVFDLAYLDLDRIFGVDWRLGRQAYTLSPIGASDYGLLFDPGNFNGPAAIGMADGLRGRATLAGLRTEFGMFRHDTTLDVWTGRAELGLIPGWTFGLSGISQRRNHTAAVNPNTSDTGWSVDLRGSLVPGLGFGAAWATFSPAAGAASSNAWTAWVSVDLARFGVAQFSPRANIWYKNYGATTAVIAPLYTGATTETFQANAWNFVGWGANLSLRFTPATSAFIQYESGNTKVTPTSTVTEWFVSVSHSLATRTTGSLRYFRRTVAGADTSNFYQIQLTYSY